jgi:Replicative DNA helicase
MRQGFDGDRFGRPVQELFLRYMITDANSFVLTRSIIKPEYFDASLRGVARVILDFSDQYHRIPTPDLIKAQTGVDLERFSNDEIPVMYEWYLENIEEFCRYKALELAVLEGADLLAKGKGGDIERLVKDAMSISIQKDLGTDYFANPQERLHRMRDKNNYVSTGWATLDEKLYGGFLRGALNIWAGGSGSGKSIWLQNIGLNWVEMGLNVVYFTLELAEELVSMRLDAMLTRRSTKEVIRDIDETALRLAAIKKRPNEDGVYPGNLHIKKMPEAGTTANDLRAYLMEYEIKTGKKPDAIIIDYLDLMHPNNRRIDPTNLFVKDKYTSEEMRALAHEYNCLCATASQLNRQSVEAIEFDHSHIAGGVSKINTADNVFGIFTTAAMREKGIYQLQFLKTRSSSAVGSKIELAFCPTTLRITDKPAASGNSQPRSPSKPPITQEAEDEPQIDVRDEIMDLMKNIQGLRT